MEPDLEEEEEAKLDLLEFLEANVFDLEIDFELNNIYPVLQILANKFRNIKCDVKDWDNTIQIVKDQDSSDALVRCIDHKPDINDNENAQTIFGDFQAQIEEARDSMLEAQIMYGTVKENSTYAMLGANDKKKFEESYGKLVEIMKSFKQNIINEKDKELSYPKLHKLIDPCSSIKTHAENFYNIGAEHALKKPLNEMAEQIVRFLDNQDEEVKKSEDISVNDGVLSFRRNLVPALPEEQFKELQQKLNSHKELSDEITKKDEEIKTLYNQIEDMKQKKRTIIQQERQLKFNEIYRQIKGNEVSDGNLEDAKIYLNLNKDNDFDLFTKLYDCNWPNLTEISLTCHENPSQRWKDMVIDWLKNKFPDEVDCFYFNGSRDKLTNSIQPYFDGLVGVSKKVNEKIGFGNFNLDLHQWMELLKVYSSCDEVAFTLWNLNDDFSGDFELDDSVEYRFSKLSFKDTKIISATSLFRGLGSNESIRKNLIEIDLNNTGIKSSSKELVEVMKEHELSHIKVEFGKSSRCSNS